MLAVPVVPPSALAALREATDDIVYLKHHEALGAIGLYYSDFSQVSDDEIVRALGIVSTKVVGRLTDLDGLGGGRSIFRRRPRKLSSSYRDTVLSILLLDPGQFARPHLGYPSTVLLVPRHAENQPPPSGSYLEAKS